VTGPLVVWGAGAIGGTIGAALVRAGEDVLFVDRAADHVAAINSRGLEIVGPVDPHLVTAKAVTPDALEGSYERILLCVKAHDTAMAARSLLPHLTKEGYVVSVQNGLNERVIADVVGRERTIGSFVNFGADYMEPGVVEFGGRGAVVVGELDGHRTPRIVELHALFRRFDDGAVLTDNIWGFLWSKMIYGALLFATAVTNEGIADLLADPRYRDFFVRFGQEVGAVAAAEKIALESFNGFYPQAFLPGASKEIVAGSFDEMVAHNRRSAKSHSGIWRDLAIRKRKTEVDAQLGPIVTIGAAHGLKTPVTAAVIAAIHAVEDGRAALGLAALDALARVASEPVAAAAS
jgi:2-dehydropantoate 2-reductase